MKILLLCDRESLNEGKPIYDGLTDNLTQAGYTVEGVTLNSGEINPCIGCFGCWFKTPGICVITGDSANSIAEKEIGADAVLLLSEITYGGLSSDIKAFLDRSVQNILPFFEIYKGEMHHEKRYERFPIWIAVGYGDVSHEEKQTFIKLADRNALNLRPPKHLALTIANINELSEKGKSILKVLEAGI